MLDGDRGHHEGAGASVVPGRWRRVSKNRRGNAFVRVRTNVHLQASAPIDILQRFVLRDDVIKAYASRTKGTVCQTLPNAGDDARAWPGVSKGLPQLDQCPRCSVFVSRDQCMWDKSQFQFIGRRQLMFVVEVALRQASFDLLAKLAFSLLKKLKFLRACKPGPGNFKNIVPMAIFLKRLKQFRHSLWLSRN